MVAVGTATQSNRRNKPNTRVALETLTNLILQAQGLLEVVPRRGVKILPDWTDDMLEIYQVLTAVEGLAVDLAAQRDLAPEEFGHAEKAIVEMEASLKDDNREAWAVADEIFHSELVRLSGNSGIAAIAGFHNNQVRRARAVTFTLRPSSVQSNEDHLEVFKAIRKGDGERAKRLHIDHRVTTGELLPGLLSSTALG